MVHGLHAPLSPTSATTVLPGKNRIRYSRPGRKSPGGLESDVELDT